ncbi:MAG TPA: 3-methyl-2-oxobutanoate hydroxymethyltransferase [Burkholderiales bacterium]|jgi:3-methyl-2-oxobutanoate hydroxymethyltransferase|nr:3-methyl-2-oxobutanoate hydroxymethyltransferase [Burkholderiales bacterium]
MKVTTSTLRKMVEEGDRITMLTCTDASFAALLDAAGVDTFLVGDSLGMVIQGHDSTLPVSMEDMIYHTRCVARRTQRALIIGDMPFGSYQKSPQQAFENAARLMSAGAQMIKLEGGEIMAETVAFLVPRGIPVCGHIGLTPQSVHALGGYRVQGKTEDAVQALIRSGKTLQEAGASLMVVELVPAPVGRALSEALEIPVMGIGAGPHCDGQILNLYDMLDVYPGKKPRFVKNFMQGAGSVQQAIANFVAEVKAGTFPGPEHSF